MNWARVILAGMVAGVVTTIVNFVLHGMILGNTYAKYPEVFTQEQANPLTFFLVGIFIGIPVAILFARTRNSWRKGSLGGAIFGFFLGLVVFFLPMYDSIVIESFPYFLSWCWGGINLIGFVVYGLIVGIICKGPDNKQSS